MGQAASEHSPREQASWAPDAGNVGPARRFVAAAVGSWGLHSLAGVAALVTSELVGNVVRHAHTRFCVTVERTPDGVLLRVEDGSPTMPSRRPRGERDLDGRGLHLLDACCRSWGSTADGHGGKVVWALLADDHDHEACLQEEGPSRCDRASSAATAPRDGEASGG